MLSLQQGGTRLVRKLALRGLTCQFSLPTHEVVNMPALSPTMTSVRAP